MDQLDKILDKWTRLLSEMLCLDVMPYAPWHKGMGACVDVGNACIDGGFNDLLTLVAFDAIPSEGLFRASLDTSITLLAETISAMAAASLGIPPAADADSATLAVEFVKAKLRENVLGIRQAGFVIDSRLNSYFFPPAAADLVGALHRAHQKRMNPAQYLGSAEVSSILSARSISKYGTGS
jgi:hypothetical protein